MTKGYHYDMLSKWKPSPTRIRGQGYDGASNMSGAFNGMKTLIMNETKHVYFIIGLLTSYS